jgi:hypothetical protein
MFSRIAAALSDLPESQRALRTAIELARACNSELATVSILGDLPGAPRLPSLSMQVLPTR